MKLKFLSILFVGLLNSSLADLKADEAAIEKACFKETNVQEKEYHDFWEKNVNYDKTTPNMKCQLKCGMEKMGHLKDGVFDADKAAKDWKELGELDEFDAINPKAFTTCKQEKGANDCETAFKIIKCLRQFKA